MPSVPDHEFRRRDIEPRELLPPQVVDPVDDTSN